MKIFQKKPVDNQPEEKAKRITLIDILYNGIEAGDRFTIREWADRLKTSEASIRSMLSDLRHKRGYEVYPVGGSSVQQGVLVNILNDESNFIETANRYHDRYLNPALSSSFRMIENASTAFVDQSGKQIVGDQAQKISGSIKLYSKAFKGKFLNAPKK